MTASAPWNRAKRVLAIRLDNLGDVLMTTPAIAALKRAMPGRQITLLASLGGAEAAPLLADVDEVIVYESPWMKATAQQATSAADHDMVARLRAGRFDAAVIFTVYSQNPLPAAMLCHLADIPLRLAHCRENPYQLLTDWIKEPEPETRLRHEVQRQLDLVEAIGAPVDDERMRVVVPAAACHRVDDLLAELGLLGQEPWAVIHAGASAPSRRYPAERFAKVARALTGRGCAVVFTGGPSECGLVEQIRAAMDAPSHSLVGRLGLAELAALLSRAPVLISNNTGPVHLAAAVGTAVVDIYALTNPQHAPWGVPHRVLYQDVPCRFCYKSVCPEGHNNCIRQVPAQAVVTAALELMGPAVSAPTAHNQPAVASELLPGGWTTRWIPS